MNTFKILVTLLALGLFATAAPALAGSDKPFYEDKLYHSGQSITGQQGQAVDRGPLFEDRYENFLYETDEGIAGRAGEGDINRLYGVESSWEFQG